MCITMSSGIVVRGGPERAGRVHEVAVGLDGDREDAPVLVGERRSQRDRQAAADAGPAGAAQHLILLGDGPQAARPADAVAHDERPLLVLDGVPHLGGEPPRADRARVPHCPMLRDRVLICWCCLA